jgi:hypothetical protein
LLDDTYEDLYDYLKMISEVKNMSMLEVKPFVEDIFRDRIMSIQDEDSVFKGELRLSLKKNS